MKLSTAGRQCGPTMLSVVLLWGGCSALTVPNAPPVSSPLAPVWNESDIRGNLSFLQSDAVRGRADGTVGLSIAAAYVADRFDDYRLQPALESDFRILYNAERNVVSGARLQFEDADSVEFIRGSDYLPDGRSGPFDGVARIVWVGDIGGAANERGSALLWFGEPDPAAAMEIRKADIDILLLQGRLRPRRSPAAWPGSIVQITPAAMRKVLLQSRADPDVPNRRILDRALRLRIASAESRVATGINVIGYVPGKHPEHASEAVVLCTHLDAMGRFAGVAAIDLRNFGVEVAAVMETARQYSQFSRFTRIPERTLIVAIVSGGTVDSSGLRALLESPVWAADMTRKVIYVGTSPGLKEAIPRGLPLETVVAPYRQALPDTVVLVPGNRRTASRGISTSANGYIGSATESAMELASRVYALLAADLMAAEPGVEVD